MEAEMATLTTHPHRTDSLFGRFGEWMSNIASALREAREMSERYETLTRMSNSELARVGISRSEIPHAVVFRR